MIHVIATVELQPGARERFLQEFSAVVPHVRAEAGCLEYGPAVDLPTALAAQVPPRLDVVVVVERWTDVAALNAHLDAPHVRAYRERVRDLVIRTSIQVLSPVEEPAGVLMRPVGRARTPYAGAAEVPKGPGARHEADGVLEILPEYEAGLRDIEGFSHLYVLWVFDRSTGCELIGTPPSDDRPHGVFATRSPRRPNPVGLTVVRLLERDGSRLHVRGVDMLDGTLLLDVKPYLSSVPDSELQRGWLAEAEERNRREPRAR